MFVYFNTLVLFVRIKIIGWIRVGTSVLDKDYNSGLRLIKIKRIIDLSSSR